MNIYEAKILIGNGKKLSKKTIKWKVPVNLRIKNHKAKKTIIGIGKWAGTKKIYICLSQRNELIYIEKSLWLEIAKNLRKLLIKKRIIP